MTKRVSLLVHYSKGFNSQDLARLKWGVRNSVWLSHVSGSSPDAWAMCCCCPWRNSREFHQKQSNWDLRRSLMWNSASLAATWSATQPLQPLCMYADYESENNAMRNKREKMTQMVPDCIYIEYLLHFVLSLFSRNFSSNHTVTVAAVTLACAGGNAA